MLHSHGCWQEDLVPCQETSQGLLECPHSMAAGFLRVSDLRKNKEEATVPFNI